MPDEIQEAVITQTSEPKTPSFTEWREAKNQPAAEVSDASKEAESVPDAEAGEDHRSEEAPREEQEQSDQPEEPPKQGRRKLQEEVGYLRRKNREEREQLSREISELRTQLDSLRQGSPQPKPQETKAAETGVPAMPSLGNYPSVEEWEADVAKWIDQRDEARERLKTQQSEQQRQQAEWTKAQQHWAEVSEKAERTHPGFNEDVNGLISRGYVSPALGRTIVQEAVDLPDAAVSVVRYLTQKPDEAKRISGLNDQRTVLEIGRLIERFTNPVVTNSGAAATKQPAAPAKTTVLNGSGAQGKRLGEAMTLQEFRQIKAKQAAARH